MSGVQDYKPELRKDAGPGPDGAKKKKNLWNSPAMWVGGSVCAILLFIAVWALESTTPEDKEEGRLWPGRYAPAQTAMPPAVSPKPLRPNVDDAAPVDLTAQPPAVQADAAKDGGPAAKTGGPPTGDDLVPDAPGAGEAEKAPGEFQPSKGFGSGGFQTASLPAVGGAGSGASAAAGPSAGRAERGPAAAAAAGGASRAGTAARAADRRGVDGSRSSRALGTGGASGSGQKLGGGNVGDPTPRTFGSATGGTTTTDPNNASITGTNPQAITGTGAGPNPGYTGPGQTPGGNPGSGSNPGPGTSGGGGGNKGAIDRQLSEDETEREKLRREVTKPSVDLLSAIMKKYSPEVVKARKAIDRAPKVDDDIAAFDPSKGGPMADADLFGDLTLYRDLVLNGQPLVNPDGSPWSADQVAAADPDGQTYLSLGLRGRLDATDDMLKKDGTCLADFKGTFPKSDAAKNPPKAKAAQDDSKDWTMNDKNLLCVKDAEKALRRRSDPPLGFKAVINQARSFLTKKSLQKKLGDLQTAAKDKSNPDAKKKLTMFVGVLKKINTPLQQAYMAFKTDPYKAPPGGTKKAATPAALAPPTVKHRDRIQTVAQDYAGLNLSGGPNGEAVDITARYSNASTELNDADLGFTKQKTHPYGGADVTTDPIAQFGTACRDVVESQANLQQADLELGTLRKNAPN